MKKISALILALAMLLSLAACKDSEAQEPETLVQAVTDQNGENVTDEFGEEVFETVTVPATKEDNEETSEATTEEETTEEETSLSSADPAKWSDEEIVDFYKKAAIKSKNVVTSKQEMTMESMVVNNGDGFIGKMVDLATPIMKSALKNSSTEFDGITGGYENLTVSDAKTIRAYKSGSYTVVEMTMKEQTDGIHGDTYSGTVGHAISVVGDISVVADALPQFNIDFDNAVLKLRYSDPKLKVKINENGIIEKGTWTYTVNVTVEDLYIAAVKFPLEVTIGSAYGSVGYIITVGGGF